MILFVNHTISYRFAVYITLVYWLQPCGVIHWYNSTKWKHTGYSYVLFFQWSSVTNQHLRLVSSEWMLTRWAKTKRSLIAVISVHLEHRGLILLTQKICSASFCCLIRFLPWAKYSRFDTFAYLAFPFCAGKKKKKGSIEENEENCNLNIHKALCLFPPICVRERSCYSAVDFWQLPSHCNLSVSKVTPVLLRSTSDLNITVRLGEDADRLDTAEADIISLSLNSSTPRHLSTVN